MGLPIVRRRMRLPLVALMALLAALLLVPLTIGTASAAYPGANGKIAFTRANQVYTINPTGTGLVRLTSAAKNYWPRWSPDGRRIAYIHETSDGRRDIWVMNADGSSKTQVTTLGNVFGASWSPDGSKLAFGGGAVGESTNLMTIRSTAPFGQPTTVMGYYQYYDPSFREPIGVEGATAWSPDGQGIWFYTHQYPDSPDNYIVRYDVASQVFSAWTASGGACCGWGTVTQPAVSADGTRIAYTRTPFNAPHIVMTSYPDGATIPFITKAQDEQLAFAPNGQRVALMNDSSGIARIILAKPDGSGRTGLTNGYQPDWQPRPL